MTSQLLISQIESAAVVGAAMFSSPQDLLMTALVVTLVVVFIGVGYTAFFKKRLIENVPTSKCQGVTIGLNELKGKVNCQGPLTSFLSERPAVYYSYTVKEQWKKRVVQDGKSKTKTGWKTIDSGTEMTPFFLHDNTGKIRVNPRGAEFHGDQVINRKCRRMDPMYYGKGPRKAIANSTGRRRFRETIIGNGSNAYVMGTVGLQQNPDIVRPEVHDDEFGEAYLIASKSEDELIKKFGRKSTFSFLGSWITAAAGPHLFLLLAYEENVPEASQEAAMVLSIALAALVPLVIAGLYAKTLFNGLVDLRNRVRRAWAMLDVEFKRRHDLIPNLVNVVKSVASHEREVLESVVRSRQRVQMSDQPDGEQARQVAQAINQQSAGLQQLFAVAEDYPELKSDGAFQKLMSELKRCEDKIALARQFYNDSVECVNNRVGTFPDMLFAGLAGAKEEDYLEFQSFEKKPVDVDLSRSKSPGLQQSPGAPQSPAGAHDLPVGPPPSMTNTNSQ